MPWAAIAGSVLGGMMSGDAQQTQTQSKEPWAAAAPWLRGLLDQGQQLNTYYQQNPFSQAQTQAYGNAANQGAYMRSLVPGLLSQLSAQPLGFDRSNPTARPQAFNFGSGGGAPNLSLLNGGGMNPTAGIASAMAALPKPVVTPVVNPNANYNPWGDGGTGAPGGDGTY